MIRRKYGIHFNSHGNRPALTLKHEYVSNNKNAIGMQSRTHKSGWTIFGKIKSCYFTWVNKFKATHPTHGIVRGDFEKIVYPDSEEGFQDFIKKHPPEKWDYWNI